VRALSGGERARLMMARALALPSNLLVLDEPTNDLDLETLDLLEELIQDYAGTVILVSHDRDFIDRTATATLAYESDGVWRLFAGGYSDMASQRGEGVTARAAANLVTSRDAPTQTSARTKPQNRAKMSFKDKHALESLPVEIETLTGRITALEAELADAGLFTRDHARFQAASAELERLSKKKAEKENRWLELELLREEIEGA